MAELTYKSPGVGTREIDLSGPTQAAPQGVPAGVIGTSLRGPAFVPVTVASYADFVNKFGPTDGEKFGPLAMNEWFRTARAGTYVRVLGVGDAKKRTAVASDNAGKVTNAGFVVGSQQVQSNGDLGANPYAVGNYTGRTYFLGCYMSESSGVTVFSSAGAQTSTTSIPVLRGVVLAPSGVRLSLSGNHGIANNLPATSVPDNVYGFVTGSVKLLDTSGNAVQEFVLLLSGHKATATYPNIVTASFDPQSTNYFADIFNTDPTKIEQAGHYLYTAYDAYRSYTVVTGTGVSVLGPGSLAGTREEIAFVLSGTQNFNTGSATVPNFEGFEDRFQTAFSPFVVSQDFGGSPVNLFKIHALDDGAYANTKFKISVRNITPSTDPTSEYGSFDLYVREFGDTDDVPQVLESFIGLTINPASDRYIGKMVGDMHTYYDFDRVAGAQKLVVEGNYSNMSSYIRVEIPDDVENQEVPADALPMGFRGINYLNIAGANQLTRIDTVKMLPVPFRQSLALGTGTAASASPYFHWGVQFEVNNSSAEPNKNTYTDDTVSSLTKYFSNYFTVSANPWTTASADTYNNNLFTLTRVQVTDTSSLTGYPDPNKWSNAGYARNGTLGTGFTRFIDAGSDFSDFATRKFLKFSFFVQGGFDGVNVFNSDKSKLLNNAAAREMDFTTTQGGPDGSTVSAYRKAIDILQDKSFADIQILAIPGLREPGVTDYAIDAVTNRFDAIYLMDVEERNISDEVVTGSGDTVSVSLTANGLKNRRLDTSFAAAYFPDVVMTDPSTQTNLICPPTVAVLGAFGLNDSLAYPWFAPAGFTRGALSTVVEVQTKLNRDNLDTLYSNDVNPITTIAGSSTPVVYGQKTLLARSSALDRVNVRRLLIDLRRRVRNVANTILFEPNRAATLARFSALVDPILKQIQAQQGVDRYKVKIDATTTTQADVENNTIRGKIFIQPTRSVEFISLDFVVSNPNVEI